MITMNVDTNKSNKCINCGVCVENCPTGALAFVPWTRVQAEAQARWQA
jgi:ferredoxin